MDVLVRCGQSGKVLLGVRKSKKLVIRNEELVIGGWFLLSHCLLKLLLRQYRIILSADTASEVRQLLSQKRR